MIYAKLGMMYMPFEAKSAVQSDVTQRSHTIIFAALSRVLEPPIRLFVAILILIGILALPITTASAALLGTNLFPTDNP